MKKSSIPFDTEHLVGLEKSLEMMVDETVTASAVGSGGVEVLATPSMILMFEQAARDAVQDSLPEGWTTVGTKVDVEHLAATPKDELVRVSAKVTGTCGRRIVFHVTASDRMGTVGQGTHERFIVELKSFINRIADRYSR